ncbi:MAG: hypothetical protein GX416_08825 [Bacteroidales bacterium]|nr:hypothetical protein [Bacteroidales bacterium]
MKKKYFALSLLAIAAMMTACSTNDDLVPSVTGKETNVSLTVNVGGLSSRSENTAGYTSESGGWTNYWANNNGLQSNYDYRVIVQVFAQGQPTTPIAEVRQPMAVIAGSSAPTNNQISIENLRLPAGNTYRAVAWIDFQAKGTGDADLFYNTSNLASVTMKGVTAGTPYANGGDKAIMKDCYTGTVDFTLTSDGAITGEEGSTLNITAKRPLANVRVVLTDYSTVQDWKTYFSGQDVNRIMNAAAMKVSNLSTGFNAYSGTPTTASGDFSFYSTYSYNAINTGNVGSRSSIKWIQATGTKANNDLHAVSLVSELPSDGTGYYPVLDFNYFIPTSNNASAVYNMAFESLAYTSGAYSSWDPTVTAEGSSPANVGWKVLSVRNISSVPVKTNCLTTIWGNMLTAGYNFLVTVNDGFNATEERVILNDDGTTVSTYIVGDDANGVRIVVNRDNSNNITSITVDQGQDKLTASNYSDVITQLNLIAGNWTSATDVYIYPNSYLPATETDGIITGGKAGKIHIVSEGVLASSFALSGVTNPLDWNTETYAQTQPVSITSTNLLTAASGSGSFRNITLATTGTGNTATLTANTTGTVSIDAPKAIISDGTHTKTASDYININANQTGSVGLISGNNVSPSFTIGVNVYSDMVISGGTMDRTKSGGVALYTLEMKTGNTELDAYVDNFGFLTVLGSLINGSNNPTLYCKTTFNTGNIGTNDFIVMSESDFLNNSRYNSDASLKAPI